MNDDNSMLETGHSEEQAPPTSAPIQPETNATGGEEAKAQSPPESYALDFGSYGENVDADEAAFISKIAQESGADAAVASRMLQDLMLYGQVKNDMQIQEWEAASRADPEFGGDKLEETLTTANRVFEAYDQSGAIRALLNQTGYGNHPELVRFFLAIGRDLSADRMVGGGRSSDRDPRNLFPNTPGLNP